MQPAAQPSMASVLGLVSMFPLLRHQAMGLCVEVRLLHQACLQVLLNYQSCHALSIHMMHLQQDRQQRNILHAAQGVQSLLR